MVGYVKMARLLCIESNMGSLLWLVFTIRDTLFRVIIRFDLSICMTGALNIHAQWSEFD